MPAYSIFRQKCRVKRCPHKNMVSWSPSLSYSDQIYYGLWIRIHHQDNLVHDRLKIDNDQDTIFLCRQFLTRHFCRKIDQVRFYDNLPSYHWLMTSREESHYRLVCPKFGHMHTQFGFLLTETLERVPLFQINLYYPHLVLKPYTVSKQRSPGGHHSTRRVQMRVQYCYDVEYFLAFEHLHGRILFIFNDSQSSRFYMYSVMQSDRNSICGVVVLDSFNLVYSDEDSIFDKKI